MCKESMLGSPCPACGNRIYYVEQHYPHCRARTLRDTPEKKRNKLLEKLLKTYEGVVNRKAEIHG